MSLLTLRSFMEVFRARSISAAARNLGLTQPAVSGHVASLEAQVGRTLFLRQARGVEPTPFAEDLALEIGDSLDQAEAALAKARVRSTHVSGVVYVTGPAELMAERVAPAIKSLQGCELRRLSGRQGGAGIHRLDTRGPTACVAIRGLRAACRRGLTCADQKADDSTGLGIRFAG